MIPTIRPPEPSSSIVPATTSSVSGSSVPKPSSRKIDSIGSPPWAAASTELSARASASASEVRNVSPPDSERASRTSSALRWSTTRNDPSAADSE